MCLLLVWPENSELKHFFFLLFTGCFVRAPNARWASVQPEGVRSELGLGVWVWWWGWRHERRRVRHQHAHGHWWGGGEGIWEWWLQLAPVQEPFQLPQWLNCLLKSALLRGMCVCAYHSPPLLCKNLCLAFPTPHGKNGCVHSLIGHVLRSFISHPSPSVWQKKSLYLHSLQILPRLAMDPHYSALPSLLVSTYQSSQFWQNGRSSSLILPYFIIQ